MSDKTKFERERVQEMVIELSGDIASLLDVVTDEDYLGPVLIYMLQLLDHLLIASVDGLYVDGDNAS